MRKIHTHIIILVVLLIGGSFLQACAENATSPAPEKKHIKVLMQPYMSNIVLAIAQEEGYFSAQGLDVEFVTLSGDTEALVALVQGDLDVSLALIDAGILNLITQGSLIRIVADKGFIDPNGCTVNAIMVHKDLLDAGVLEDPTGWQDRVASIEPETLDGFVMAHVLSPLNLTLDDIQAVNLPRPAEVDAFANGSLDITMTGEPWVTRLIQAGDAEVWKPLQEIMPGMQYAVILFGPNLLEDDPDAGRSFMVAYLQALQQYSQGKTERNMELMIEFTGDEPAFLQEACWPAYRADGRINTQSILDFQSWADEKGLLEGIVTVEQFWDPSFIEYAITSLDAP